MSLGQDYSTVRSTCYANGADFGSFRAASQEITMLNRIGLTLAQPSDLSGDGSSFTVKWYATS